MCSVESATCPVVESDRSSKVTRRNFKVDISFKEHDTGQTVVDNILTIQNKFSTHFKGSFLLSTHHQSDDTCDKPYHAGNVNNGSRTSYIPTVGHGIKHCSYLNGAFLPDLINGKHKEVVYRKEIQLQLIPRSFFH